MSPKNAQLKAMRTDSMKKGRVATFLLWFIVLSGFALHDRAFSYTIPRPDDFSDVSGKTEIDCKDALKGRVMVALAFGQSNSANSGETRHAAKRNVYNFFDGHCYVAADPMLGTNGAGGTVWSRLGDRLIEEGLYDNVLFVTIGVGGTEIQRWTEGGDLNRRIADVISQLKKKKIRITHILWHQGEADKARKTPKEDYKSMFMRMLSTIRKRGLNAPIYVSVATRCGGGEPGYEIQQAQRELVNVELGIYPGPDTDALNGLDDRHDACHFSDRGLEKHAELWLRAIRLSGR